MRDIFVIAGNYREFLGLVPHFEQAFKDEFKKRMVHYVHSPVELEGVHGARIIVCGQYFKRKDWGLLEHLIEPSGNRRLLIR